ncbi:mRNA stability protein mug134 [Aspergillus awamori]|uniref:mRNA stability protein n=4 Tax=Aspergillus TaxID=5052 RepID=A0A3F3QAP5_9EURO|nr:hypothetical protein BDQ94DRAFT_168166 [Aspergillus welwitschiae]KAI2829270.1 hypothetical protein CBS133816_4546 [Aspergillus niger]RDK42381.1 hypothetical protein M752DRAFT_293494 [Aspergillus phoenicis ATCC 13157]GCB21201.1 mRNA stability protein mug134 [Aspergillus awamori]KAI2856914.1 hypothetical protein CBS12448_6728 [Aspergillus niger]KAI2903735.1 hypothetical protein CBS11852_1746 [Aspergillus niger]
MDLKSDKEVHDRPLSERDKRILTTYGRLPCGGSLGQQPKKRTYFDSGDYALSAAHRVTDSGDDIKTGTAHPVRESISHPFAPVPSTGNAGNEANNGIFEDKSAITQTPRSPLSRNPSFSE